MADLAQLADTVELLEEALIDAQMAADNAGWLRLGDTPAQAAAARERLTGIG